MAIRSDGKCACASNVDPHLVQLQAKLDRIQHDFHEIETDVRAIRADIVGIRTTDFRLLFGAIITLGLGLGGLMAKGFGWL